jgi:hypothetical protein
MKEEQDEMASRESTTNRQLNEILINFFGNRIDGKAQFNATFHANSNHCQLCNLEEHVAPTCLKLIDTRPKCAKCGDGHKTDNHGLKCSFYCSLGHTENRCWKKIAKGIVATTNFLEVLVNDEEATLSKLNHIYGDD